MLRDRKGSARVAGDGRVPRRRLLRVILPRARGAPARNRPRGRSPPVARRASCVRAQAARRGRRRAEDTHLRSNPIPAAQRGQAKRRIPRVATAPTVPRRLRSPRAPACPRRAQSVQDAAQWGSGAVGTARLETVCTSTVPVGCFDLGPCSVRDHAERASR